MSLRIIKIKIKVVDYQNYTCRHINVKTDININDQSTFCRLQANFFIINDINTKFDEYVIQYELNL